MPLSLDGRSLGLDDVVRVARPPPTECCSVALDPKARDRLARARAHVESKWLNGTPGAIYGFNTGVGRLMDWTVPPDRMTEFQRLLVNAHGAGTGPPFPEDVVRATMLLRANANARGHSGVRPDVVERLLSMLQAGVHPVVPQKGSVGASGDLAPLAYISAALMGHPRAEVTYRGERMAAAAALRQAGLSAAFDLEAKEALALLNGSTVSLAVATLASHDAVTLALSSEVALAMTMEALRADLTPFDNRIHAARPHPGQLQTATAVRQLLEGSERCSAPRASGVPGDPGVPLPRGRLQDAYSIRCAPQVHGPVRDALRYVRNILRVELNSATDNPLMFPVDDASSSYDVLSGGNFHGQYIAQAMDLLALATTDLGSISERRASRLLDPSTSFGLPVNLVAGDPGLNTGFSVAQCSMAALVAENRTLSVPASADSIPTKSNQEDHISNSTWCSRKAAEVVRNALAIVSIELLMATQALAVAEPKAPRCRLGRGTQPVYSLIRDSVPASFDGDRWIHDDIGTIAGLVETGAVLDAARMAFSDGVDKI
ncbi:MAG: aromatic amino acid lyase [Deltaproteobacteria bacterium]|nr:aromatic amino acid lyase [Deltaproteobacteria bacterium]